MKQKVFFNVVVLVETFPPLPSAGTIKQYPRHSGKNERAKLASHTGPQGADSLPLPLRVAKTEGKNHLYKEITPPSSSLG